MRVRTGHGPDDWDERGPAAARFHGVAAWGSRGAAVVGGTNRPVPNVIRENLRTPETASSKAARLRRADKAVLCGEWMAKAHQHCARSAGHLHGHKSRTALDNMAVAMAEVRS